VVEGPYKWHARPDKKRVGATNRDRRGDRRRDQRGPELAVRGIAPEPDRELGADREERTKRPVDLHRVKPETAQARKPRVHDSKVDGGEPSVISRSADPGAPKDQPIG
jgi:hypothetical protein